MLLGRLVAWEVHAEEPLLAALKTMFPSKMEHSVKQAVRRIMADTGLAFECYEAGAAAAILDITDLLTTHHIPLPSDVAVELGDLACAALSGETISKGRGTKSSLEQHRLSLIKRLRFHFIQDVLDDAAMNLHEDDPVNGILIRARLSSEDVERIRASRPAASSVKEAAIRIAMERMPAALRGPATTRAYREDHVEVAKEVRNGSGWPGRFYLPTRQTCENLGWEDLSAAFLQLGVPADAPSFGVS